MNRPWIPLGTLLLAGALAATLFALPTTAQANGCPLRFSQGTDGTAANPIRIDGHRPAQAACAPLGADNESLLDRGT